MGCESGGVTDGVEMSPGSWVPPEALNRVFKTEVIRRHAPWRTLEHVEFEVLKWVDWYNRARLHSWCQDIPPLQFENAYYAAKNPSPATVEETHLTLH